MNALGVEPDCGLPRCERWCPGLVPMAEHPPGLLSSPPSHSCPDLQVMEDTAGKVTERPYNQYVGLGAKPPDPDYDLEFSGFPPPAAMAPSSTLLIPALWHLAPSSADP